MNHLSVRCLMLSSLLLLSSPETWAQTTATPTITPAPGLGAEARPPFAKSQARLIVLAYGYSAEPTAPAVSAATRVARSAALSSGTLAYARNYWGFDFVSNLIGGNGTLLYTGGGEAVTRRDWISKAARDSKQEDHFIYASKPKPGEVPPVGVLFTHRDASLFLVPQTRALITETYDRYNAKALGNPNLIFVVHSMGGLVGRTLLTAPAEPIGGDTLSLQERLRAAFLRERTLYMVTLATPHEGSRIADKSDNIERFLTQTPPPMEQVLQKLNIPNLRASATGFLGAVDAVQHLRSDFMLDLNRGLLAPHKMTRPDGSLIPLYALVGRVPGGAYFDDMGEYPFAGIPLSPRPPERLAFEALGLTALDWGMYNAPGGRNTWGNVGSLPSYVDKAARYFVKVSLGGGKPVIDIKDPLGSVGNVVQGTFAVSEAGERPVPPNSGFPVYYKRGETDGHVDSDGMTATDSGLGVRLGTNINDYFDHTKQWSVDGKEVTGSWYRLTSGIWDRDNHGNIMHDADVGDWLRKNVLSVAGPLPRRGATSGWPLPVRVIQTSPVKISQP